MFILWGMPRTRCAHRDRPSLGREARAGRGGALQTDHRVTPWHAVHAVRKGVPMGEVYVVVLPVATDVSWQVTYVGWH